MHETRRRLILSQTEIRFSVFSGHFPQNQTVVDITSTKSNPQLYQSFRTNTRRVITIRFKNFLRRLLHQFELSTTEKFELMEKSGNSSWARTPHIHEHFLPRGNSSWARTTSHREIHHGSETLFPALLPGSGPPRFCSQLRRPAGICRQFPVQNHSQRRAPDQPLLRDSVQLVIRPFLRVTRRQRNRRRETLFPVRRHIIDDPQPPGLVRAKPLRPQQQPCPSVGPTGERAELFRILANTATTRCKNIIVFREPCGTYGSASDRMFAPLNSLCDGRRENLMEQTGPAAS